jgi:hypothetical protein
VRRPVGAREARSPSSGAREEGEDRHGGESCGSLLGSIDRLVREADLTLTLISVAIGLGLAVAYYAASLRFQLVVTKRSGPMVPALTALGLVLRLTVFAVILVLLALFTELNVLAVAIAFLGLFTVLQVLGMHHYIAKAKRGRSSEGSGSEGGVLGG